MAVHKKNGVSIWTPDMPIDGSSIETPDKPVVDDRITEIIVNTLECGMLFEANEEHFNLFQVLCNIIT